MKNITKFLLVTVSLVILAACKTTPEETITRIPYSLIAGDMEFWDERSESPFTSLHDFSVRVKTSDSVDIYLINRNGETKGLASADTEFIGPIKMPKMSLKEAENWTLIVDKPQNLVRITPNIKTVLPAKKVRYKDLFVVLKDLDRRRDEVDSMPSWLRQGFYRFFFTFPSPSTVVYQNEESEQESFDVEKGRTLILNVNEDYYKENGWLIFSELPDTIMPLN